MANEKAMVNIRQMKGLIASDSMKNRMNNVLGKEAGTFLASVLDLYTSDTNLMECDPNLVMAECMKAASLHLPVSKALGFAYIIPYKNRGVPVPQFQLGYKGLVQLAQRTGQYKYINADVVYEGETAEYDRITGMLRITGEATSDKAVGYFAYFQLVNGFEKAIYWSRERVEAHAKRYSKAYNYKDAPWQTQFDEMAIKTVLKRIISKYGIMSVEFADAVAKDAEDSIEQEVEQNANGAPILIADAGQGTAEYTNVDQETGEIKEESQNDIGAEPGF